MDRWRNDIEGLRGIAIIGVLLFHFDKGLLPGGFLGVDIFLVISGFLITSQICHKIEKGDFDLLSFYRSRALRILPALIATVSIFHPLFHKVYDAVELKSVSQSIISTIFSFSNFYFCRHSGYFERNEMQKPLLHTWSLSLEVQFYAFCGFIFWFCGTRKAILVTSVVFFVVSFALPMLPLWGKNEKFFLIHTRLFEFLVGTLSYFSASLFEDKGVYFYHFSSSLGIGLMLGSYAILNESFPVPSVWSLIPCVGTALVLNSSGEGWGCYICSIKGLRYIGNISYCLYLVHWPLVIVYKCFNAKRDLNIADICLLSSCIFVMSVLLSFSIEKQFLTRSHKKNVPKLKLVLIIFLFAGNIVFIAFTKYNTVNLAPTVNSLGRVEKIVRDELNIVYKINEKTNPSGAIEWETVTNHSTYFEMARVGNKNSSKQYVLLGDSYGSHLELFADYLGRKENVSLQIWARGGCHPLSKVSFVPTTKDRERKMDYNHWIQCSSLNDLWLSRIETESFEKVFLAGRWKGFVHNESSISEDITNNMVLVDSDSNGSFASRIEETYGSRLPSYNERLDFFETKMGNMIVEIQKYTRQVVIISDIPEPGQAIRKCSKFITRRQKTGHHPDHQKEGQSCLKLRSETTKDEVMEMDERLGKMARALNVTVIYPSKLFCSSLEEKRCNFSAGSLLLFNPDGVHLSWPGSLYMALKYFNVI